MLQEQMTLPVGAAVQDPYGDRYRVEALLGKGGFGAVYLVRDRRIEQNVFALKEVVDPSSQDRKRLLLECEILKRLDHKALPRVYHVFENKKLKRVYLLMEYIKGKNLEDLRKEQPGQRFSLDLALTIMAPIVHALIYMHHQEPPIVHRDMKPANIIMPLDGGEAVLVDFGTAKEYLAEATTLAFRHGSPGYAAIEQYGGASGTNLCTDVYGLGATFYALLTGVTPIDAISRVTGEQGDDPLKPVSTLTPAIPLSVSHAIRRAMSIHKKDRFATVEEFWHAMHTDSVEQQEQVSQTRSPDTLPLPALQGGAPVPLSKKHWLVSSHRHGRVLSLLLALLIPLVVGLGSLVYVTWPAQHVTPSIASSLVQSTVTSAQKLRRSPTLTASLGTSLYPPLAASYSGTINDISVAQTKTTMYLTGIQQDQNHIRGSFQGLGLIGPFTGTVTASGEVHFTVKVYSGSTTILFDGTIKIGGDIEGTFKAVDQSGQSIGEYGPWYASPVIPPT